MESIPPPSDAFLADLERHLALLKPQRAAPVIAHTPFPLGSAADMKTLPRRGWRSVVPGGSRRVASLAAVALLAVLLIAGPLVFALTHSGPSEPPAIPAAFLAPPSMEPLMQMDFVPPLWDMPVATTWDHMEFSMFLVDPGASFSTDIPWYTSVDGPMMIVALSDDLIVRPHGPALVFRAGSDSRTPVESPAEEPVILGPNDTIVYSSADTATGTNPGSDPVRALYGISGVFVPGTPLEMLDPPDITRMDTQYGEYFTSLATDGATVSLQHLQLAPLATFVYELEPDFHVVPVLDPLQIIDLRFYEGAFDGLPPDLGAHSSYVSVGRLEYPGPDPLTLVNIGDETVDLYFLIVEPYPKTATPAA
ncbi:MAG: hypothetical protein R2848_17085 [Thermomicrobiales bacterium]